MCQPCISHSTFEEINKLTPSSGGAFGKQRSHCARFMAYQRLPDVTATLLSGRGSRVYRGAYYDLEGGSWLTNKFKEILPLLGRKIAREAVKVGADILQDVKSGMPFKEAAKLGMQRTLERAKRAAVKRLSGSGGNIRSRLRGNRSKRARRKYA
jgi:hypothetical protein